MQISRLGTSKKSIIQINEPQRQGSAVLGVSPMSDCRTENTEGEEIERIICVSFGILFYLEVPYTLDKIPAAVGE
ncbi:hypothetical protein A6V25_06035 [Nostoc sp. ATCC 53789]|nr:hypothetical protein A6V25_06035 [Nostoc sp. ATCC 53789]